MRGEPHPAVLAWVASRPRALLHTTHINQAEILYGIGALPEGDGAIFSYRPHRQSAFSRSSSLRFIIVVSSQTS